MNSRKKSEDVWKQGQSASGANARFRTFKPEGENPAGEAIVAPPTKIKALIDAWYADKCDVEGESDYAYGCAQEALEGIHATAQEIREFVEFLKKLPDNDTSQSCDHLFTDRAGTFLSVLINTSPDLEFELDFNGLRPPDDFAYENCKDVVVHGNLGDNAGHASAGKLEVFGDADGMFGYAQADGEIILHGECYGDAGHHMCGGKMTLHGEAEELGEEMSDGEIIAENFRAEQPSLLEFLGSPNTICVGRGMSGGIIRVKSVEKMHTDPRASGGQIFRDSVLVFDSGTWLDETAGERN